MGKSNKHLETGFDDRYNSTNYEPELPNTIRLKDGREFSITDLLSRCRQDAVTAHIKTFKNNPEKRKPQGRFNEKYTPEETAWLLQASREEVQERYKVDHVRALAILRYVYSKVGRVYKTTVRKPDKRTHSE